MYLIIITIFFFQDGVTKKLLQFSRDDPELTTLLAVTLIRIETGLEEHEKKWFFSLKNALDLLRMGSSLEAFQLSFSVSYLLVFLIINIDNYFNLNSFPLALLRFAAGKRNNFYSIAQFFFQ